MMTACHVVYDKKEAEWTSIDLFYDDVSSKQTILSAYDVKDNDSDNDVCILRCATHDEKLYSHLSRVVGLRRYRNGYFRESGVRKLCIVISHPHGMSKMVTDDRIHVHLHHGHV